MAHERMCSREADDPFWIRADEVALAWGRCKCGEVHNVSVVCIAQDMYSA